jgi:hypothetical protein
VKGEGGGPSDSSQVSVSVKFCDNISQKSETTEGGVGMEARLGRGTVLLYSHMLCTIILQGQLNQGHFSSSSSCSSSRATS